MADRDEEEEAPNSPIKQQIEASTDINLLRERQKTIENKLEEKE